MKREKHNIEATMFSAVKVDFIYSMKIDGSPDFTAKGSVLVNGENPSFEKIKEAVEAYVAEKAVAHLGQSEELTVDTSIDITNTSKVVSKVKITHR